MILSLDVSSRNTGYAIFEGLKLRKIGQINTYHPYEDKFLGQDIRIVKYHNEIINALINISKKCDIDKLILEVSPIPGKTGRILVLWSGIYIGACLEIFDIKEIKIVAPQQWQFLVMGAPWAKKKETWDKRKSMKELSIKTAKEFWPVLEKYNLSDDMTDAALMGSVYDKVKNKFEIDSKYQKYTKKGGKNGN